MAEMDGSWSDELLDLSGIADDVDTEVTKVLAGFDGTNRGNVEKELEKFNKRTLEDTREVFFILAKEKVVLCSKAEEEGGDATANETHDRTKRLGPCVDQWKLNNRRKNAKLAYDLMGLILYATGFSKDFPSKVVKDASLDKGSLDEDTEEEILLDQLNQDTADPAGQIVCELVDKSEESEIHRITISGDGLQERASTDENHTKDDPVEATNIVGEEEDQAKETESEDEVDSEKEGENNLETDNLGDTACTACGCDCKRRYLEHNEKSASKSVFRLAMDMARRMRMDEEEVPLTKTEFEYYVDYNDEMVSNNKKKIEGIVEWRSNVQNWMKSMEASYRKELADVKSQQEAIITELKKPRRGVPIEENPRPTQATRSDSDGSSVWEIQMEQRTPVKPAPNVSRKTNVDERGDQYMQKQSRPERAHMSKATIYISDPERGLW